MLPYLSLVGADTWMHEVARTVPRTERIIHWTLAPLLIGFLVSVFLDRTTLALGLLAVFIPLLAIDELGFHRGLARRERHVHLAAYAALALFIIVWRWTETRA
jgi:hypothetical protein